MCAAHHDMTGIPPAPPHDPYAAFRVPNLLRYMLLLLDATLMTLQRPSGAALFPSLVPPDRLENAMKWRTSSNQVSAMIGPALGAVIIKVSVPSAYVACSLAALTFIILLLSLRLKPSPAASGAMSLASLLAGLRFVWGRKVLLASVSLDMFAVLLGGATYLLPIYAKDILNVGETGFGLLRAAPAIGAFAMAILLAHLPPMRRAGRTMLLAVAGFGVATIIFGCLRTFWLSRAMLVLTGAMDNISVVVRHTMIQLLTPDAMRGRVSAVNNIFIGSSNEVGGLESGLVAHYFTPTVSVVSGGIGTLIIVGLWSLIFPCLRRFGSLTDVPEEEKAERPAAVGT